MPSAYRILEFLSEGPRTSSELHEKMNNELSDTISVSNLGNQLKLLVEKELVSKENRRGGRYEILIWWRRRELNCPFNHMKL